MYTYSRRNRVKYREILESHLNLYPGALTLIAGSETDHMPQTDTAPMIIYRASGDFEAQVKLKFNPVLCCQRAGLGVRSSQNRNNWIRIIKREGQALETVVNGGLLDTISYSDEIIYFKIERRGLLMNLFYSANGSNWITIRKDYVFQLPSEVEVFLVGFSAHNNQGITAQFSDFGVFKK